MSIPEAIGLDHLEPKKPQLWFGSGQNFGSPILGHLKSADESARSGGVSLQLWVSHHQRAQLLIECVKNRRYF
jgi:hypothetical protein